MEDEIDQRLVLRFTKKIDECLRLYRFTELIGS